MKRKKRMHKLVFMFFHIAFAMVISGAAGAAADSAIIKAPDADTKSRIESKYLKMPMVFELNQGQTDGNVKFLARGSGYNLFLSSSEALLVLSEPVLEESEQASLKKEESLGLLPKKEKEIKKAVLNMRLVNANPEPDVAGLEKQDGRVNYLIGNDPNRWRTNIPTYSKVKYLDVYSGIDLIYYGKERQLEYDFVVAPGADPKAIKLVYEGADKLEIDTKGDLVLHMAGHEIRLLKPFIYQEIDGIRKSIVGGYHVSGTHEVGFQMAEYDSGRPLIIDPVLSYSTYLGGSSNDTALSIAVDGVGNAYVAGTTFSADFPLANAAQATFGGGVADAFVTKLNPSGGLVYSTYLGGSSSEFGATVAVDGVGNAYVAGLTVSIDFPVLNAVQATNGGFSDAFVTKLNPQGKFVYSTYLGGSSLDQASRIAVDGVGNAYVAGRTSSADFPLANAAQATFGGGFALDAFVTKLDPSGVLVYSTYLGGSSTDQASSIAVDGVGNAYVAGLTFSIDFPVLNAVQATFGGGHRDSFVTRLDPSGGFIYSTYLGGRGDDTALSIAVDGVGNAYVAGGTISTDFPTANAHQAKLGGGSDAFVVKIVSVDLNGDGVENREDLLIVTRCLGQDPATPGCATADVNGDGVINGLDVSLVGQSFSR